MSENRFINVTPHPRILGVLGDIEFSHWQCLAELVDNSFDEFQAAGEIEERPSVSITLPTATATRSTAAIVVKDNGRGMSLEAVTNAISAGWTSNSRHGSLGLFGMGFNISTARLGRHTTIRTSRAGDPSWVEVVLDLPKIAESSQYQAPYRLVPKADPAEHGTTVTVSDLKSEQFDALKRPNTQNVIREKLGDIYSYLLRERGFLLTINNRKVKPRLPCVWDENRYVTRQGAQIHAIQRIDQPLKDKKACMDCGYWSRADAERCEECGQERLELRSRRIWGWIGIQRYIHKTDYGLDFLRNGRKILLKDKRVFYWQDEDELSEPELEYPIDTKIPTGRFVGEIHCDHVAPNYQKTAFEFETHEWRQVIHAIRGISPIRPNIAKSLGLPENDSPLALLFRGYRRQDPGLNYLIPGDGHSPLHDKALEWAALFRKGEEAYQSDEIWYQAAYQHDHPAVPDPHPQGGDILPGLPADPVTPEPGSGDPSTGTQPSPTPPAQEPDPIEETLDQRLQRYRDHGERILDLTGSYSLPDLGTVDLTAWTVRGQQLSNKDNTPAPVVAIMKRAPQLEVFVNVDAPLFQEQGTDVRDLALVEVAEFMRVRANKVSMPLTEIVAHLKARSTSPKLTPAALADEAERILDQVRSSMVLQVAQDPALHWELLTEAERASSERRFAIEAPSVTTWDETISSGEFVRYIPANAIVRLVAASPVTFLDGKVFARPYKVLTDTTAKELVTERLINPLSDLALLEQHRPRLDLEELARIRSSCRLIVRELADND
ncbi:ATP-binding protein [Nonomuraea deserti]|uniref:ATP-binding protein n=1 Tax=Nonomuraea deserti TaxID=1848322 RepID=A0A4R4VMS9_9ACTN|nr:ATP-binding protein [Nonomuraea deserti]TDD07138.1 ATP-binding protein [Nonomuraea deserti]